MKTATIIMMSLFFLLGPPVYGRIDSVIVHAEGGWHAYVTPAQIVASESEEVEIPITRKTVKAPVWPDLFTVMSERKDGYLVSGGIVIDGALSEKTIIKKTPRPITILMIIVLAGLMLGVSIQGLYDMSTTQFKIIEALGFIFAGVAIFGIVHISIGPNGVHSLKEVIGYGQGYKIIRTVLIVFMVISICAKLGLLLWSRSYFKKNLQERLHDFTRR